MGDYTLGQKLGDYEILGVLGAGGMGKVYKVRNTISDRIEAMKILLPNLADQKELADRFLREIKLLASLNHPNIAALRTALTLDNQLVMIMEYVDGVTLASRLQQGPVPVADAVYYIDQVLAALVYAHQMNVVHRDIKPGNMMLTPQGVVKLMDFGIARPGNEAGMTITGTTLGSLNYMSPEQVKGEKVDARSDLYSVGLSLYEILTGRLPFRGDSGYSLMVAQLQQAPEPPIVLRPDLPKPLNDIILMVLAKEPEKRFQSATAFRNALKSALPQGAPMAAAAGRSGVPSATTIFMDPTVATPPPMAPAYQPTQPAAMAAAASASKAAPPPPAAQKSHRGVWMALGGILVVAMLAGAAVYVPRRAKTQAVGGSSAAPVSVAPSPVPSPAAPPAPAPAPSAEAQAAAAKAAAQAAAAKAAADAAAQAAAAQAAAEAAAKAAALKEAQTQADQISSRAAAIDSSLTTLQRAQAAQGYGLRGDIVAAQARMQTNLARAEAALQAQDPAAAKEYLDKAENDAETLERFLGR
ncbi:MAG TPA: serine/threonine-protein kinase [Candidatus Baltobacteraceae bacterium]|nr:serine/threonine-protein kinase [Candidatus Baltobacteraceae bacterium]